MSNAYAILSTTTRTTRGGFLMAHSHRNALGSFGTLSKRSIFDADNALSLLASELLVESHRLHESLDDPITQSAPSECTYLIVRSSERRVAEILQRYALPDLDAAFELIARRTSKRWAFHTESLALRLFAD